MDYTKFLPHINVEEGKGRVMNNFGLYTTLLKKFKGRQMMDELIVAINKNELAEVCQISHALRGTAANLSFPIVHKTVADIEKLAKNGEDSSHLIDDLKNAIDGLDAAIAELTTG